MYELEVKKAVEHIRKSKAKKVFLQLSEGLRPMAKNIADTILKNTGAEVYIWVGSCFGACDVPLHLTRQLKADILIQWGHAEWKK